ncbi:hypothetical protein Micbo1qcDRAFT_161286 [Microdochium bolleyi]|uniref:Secreted protein n=1 Tax=Microdochium bolleyi TaxID=196109 RepID=A0A136J848_9PEZI|nr:hypothetical protein Micbo1qcDRAFT_161286 [Microdochium bolleyi]
MRPSANLRLLHLIACLHIPFLTGAIPPPLRKVSQLVSNTTPSTPIRGTLIPHSLSYTACITRHHHFCLEPCPEFWLAGLPPVLFLPCLPNSWHQGQHPLTLRLVEPTLIDLAPCWAPSKLPDLKLRLIPPSRLTRPRQLEHDRVPTAR